MALINEKLPEYIIAKFNNEIINTIYSYCGNTQYDIVLKQLKNIIDSKYSIIFCVASIPSSNLVTKSSNPHFSVDHFLCTQ